MRRLVITEHDGLYVVETSAGVRASGASLESALDKMLVKPDTIVRAPMTPWSGVEAVFNSIKPVSSGQIAHGQASG